MRDGSRGRELLPSILLTLLSVVQALALEALWSDVRENPFLFAGGVEAWVVGLQVLAVFLGIIVIWLLYISVVMRFSWIPSTRDSVAPFVLGAAELSMIQMMDPALLAYWFYVLAGIFLLSTWVANAMFRAAVADPINRGIELPDRNPIDRMVSRGAPAAIAVCGVVVHALGGDGAAAIICLVSANLLLLGQAALIQQYWRDWVGGVSGGSGSTAR